jgi:hypothetical protein
MSDDDLTITWPTIASVTSGAYDVNLDTDGTFSYTTIPGGPNLDNALWNTNTTMLGGANAVWTTNTTVGSSNWNIRDSNVAPSGKIHLTGDNADIVINGQSLNATLTAIQERMGILVPNADMEAEWDELCELAERYRELEKLCKEKSTVWNKLKKI